MHTSLIPRSLVASLIAHKKTGLASQLLSTYAALLSQSRAVLSLLLIWILVCQAVLLGITPSPFVYQFATKQSPFAKTNSLSPIQRPFALKNGKSTLSLLPSTIPSSATGIAIVRHAPSINGNGRVEGSLRQLTGECVTLNGGVITNDLQVPGTPKLILNGNPTFGGTIQGTGSAQPTNYQVTLNGGGTTLGHLVTRTDPIPLASVPSPPASAGTRSVTITAPGQSAGNFATLRDLTLNGNVGMFAVPPGTYRTFIANGGSGLILGVSGTIEPATYNLSTLTLNGQSKIQVVGPVKLNLAGGFVLNASMGQPSQPSWLTMQTASGGVTLNGGSSLYAIVKAPAGSVIINGNAQLVGTVSCDRLTVNGGGLLRLTDSALPPVNQPPVVNAGPGQTITLPNSAMLNGSASDDGLPQGRSLAASWTKLSGPGTITFANANNPVTAAAFSQPGTYVLTVD